MHVLKRLVVLALILNVKGVQAQPLVTDDEISQSVALALPLIESSAAEYLVQRSCFGCHHQAMSVLALTKARQRGFQVNQDNLAAQLDRMLTHLQGGQERYLEGKGQGGQADTAGYALWALHIGGQPPCETTAAVTEYLLLRNEDDDHWTSSGNRPPSEASDVTTTAIALYGLQAYGTDAQAERIAARRARATRWLLDHEPVDTEERVFRLHGLRYADSVDAEVAQLVADAIKAAGEALVRTQREDGGWSQTDQLESDAYATGSVLVTLCEVADMSPADPVYQKGLRFLVDAQHDDGSWHVKTRSKPIQTYFESGFPHKQDQFISMNASCWATYALVLAANVTTPNPATAP
jgi:N-acyl-D-amino-acid deacylase